MEAYEEVKILGRGAFGVAKLVKLKSGGRKSYRVLKQVDLTTQTESQREESHKEVGVLRQLSHRHVIAYYDAFIQSGCLYIVMEFADGGDLSSAIRSHKDEEKPFTEDEAMKIFTQCLLALKFIHAKHILHRDIKSQNIFMMQAGDAKIGDFGIAKVRDSTTAEKGTVIGTPSYLAPEICSDEPYNSKADIWSMGVVLYELLALMQPFVATNVAALVMKIMAAEFPPLPSSIRTEVSEVVKRCLQKNPEERANADDLLQMAPVSSVVALFTDMNFTGMDQFETIHKLGRGAFGTAVLVKQKMGGSSAPLRVVKTIELDVCEDEAAKKSAKSEVFLLRKLSHPHIIAYYDAFEELEQLHIVLEYADGGDLFTAVKKKKEEESFFSDDEAIILFRQCLLALHYIHGKKILHRDIKTHNIFLMKSGDAKLGDFGVSKIMEGTVAAGGTFIGTTDYVAPEVCQAAEYGSKIDVWGLGVVLFEILALRLPFHTSSMPATIMKIVGGEIPALPSRVKDEVVEVVQLALRKDPKERPSAKDLLSLPVVKRFAQEPEKGLEVDDDWQGGKTLEDDEEEYDDLSPVTMQPGSTATMRAELASVQEDAGATQNLKDMLIDNLAESMDSIDGQPKRPMQDTAFSSFSSTLRDADENLTMNGAATLLGGGETMLDGTIMEGNASMSGTMRATLANATFIDVKDGLSATHEEGRPLTDGPRPNSRLEASMPSNSELLLQEAQQDDDALARFHNAKVEAADAARDEFVRKRKEEDAARREEERQFILMMQQEAPDEKAPWGSGAARRRPRKEEEPARSPVGTPSEGLSPAQRKKQAKEEETKRRQLEIEQATRKQAEENAQAQQKKHAPFKSTLAVVGSDVDALDAQMQLNQDSRLAPPDGMAIGSSPRPIRGVGAAVVAPAASSSGPKGPMRPGSSSSSRGVDANKANAFWMAQQDGVHASEGLGHRRPSPKAGMPRIIPPSPAGQRRPSDAPLRSPGPSGTGMNDAVRFREQSVWVKD